MRRLCILFLAGYIGLIQPEAATKIRGTLTAWGGVFIPPVEPGLQYKDIQVGKYHNVALTREGRIVTWGDFLIAPDVVHTSRPSSNDVFTTIAAAKHGSHNAAVRADGSIVQWGPATIPRPGFQELEPLRGFLKLGFGSYPIGQAVLWEDGSVRIVDARADIPEAIRNLAGVLDVSSFGHHLFALADGTVMSWGEPADGFLVRVPKIREGITNVVKVAAGAAHAVALLKNGTVISWGGGSSQTNVPAHITNITAIAAGTEFSLALNREGRVFSFGRTTFDFGLERVPPECTNVIGIAAGFHVAHAIRADGTVVSWGSPVGGGALSPTLWDDVVDADAFGSHALIVRPNGEVLTFGAWPLGTETKPPTPVTNAVAVSAMPNDSAVLRKDGTIATWSMHLNFLRFPSLSNVTAIAKDTALLADGTWWTFMPRVTQIEGATNLVAISGAVALRNDGLVFARPTAGTITNVPAGLSNVVQVAAGVRHALALTAEGRVIAWGENDLGQTDVPSGLSDVESVAATATKSYAIRRNGELISWGQWPGKVEHKYGPTPAMVPPTAKIAGGDVFAIAVIPHGPPRLRAAVAPDGVRLSWPSAAVGWDLQECSSFTNSAEWLPSGTPRNTSSRLVEVDLPGSAAAKFYRLAKLDQ